MKVLLSALLFAQLLACSSGEPKSGPAVVKNSPPPRPVTMLSEYMTYLKAFPPLVKVSSCESVNYKSHRNLRRNQRNIYLSNPQMAIPNYNGMYLLLESPISNGSEWYVINCRNGKYETIVPTIGDLVFDADSRLIVTKNFTDSEIKADYKPNSSGNPKLLEWTQNNWITHVNPVQPMPDS